MDTVESRNLFVEEQLNLLELEYECELEKTRQYQSSLSIIELVRQGICLNKLRCCSIRTGLFLRTLVTLESALSTKTLPSNRITVGDIVSIQNGGSRESLTTGVVYSLSSSTICIAIEKESKVDLDMELSNYVICKISNDVTYRRMKKALYDLRDYPVGGRAHHLIEVIFGKKEPTVGSSPPSLDFFNPNLNESQKDAVAFALSTKEFSIIHGPPGTGKTTTLVELILQFQRLGLKVLVCAPSNVAIDNLVEKLAAFKVRSMVRLGHPARASPELQRYTLDASVSKSDERDIISDIRKELDSVKKSRSFNKKVEVRELMKDLKIREKDILKNSLYSSNIILSTLTSASPKGPLKHLVKNPDHQIDVLVIDECSQALEAACWIAVPLATKCILAGDHFQLPPTIISKEAAKKGLEKTLMEKCLQRLDTEKIVKMLTTQYRMHQFIMEWSSKSFYSNQLIADPSVKFHTLENIVPSVGPLSPLLLIDTAGCNMPELDLEDEESKGNENEADISAAYTKSLIRRGLSPDLIGIITPYNLQVELIRQRLSEDYPSIEIRSVDGFQGREKEVIILSLVRSNKEKETGFLSEYRRINVAITRARRHLVMICDSETVSSEPHLESLVQFLHEKGEVKSGSEFESELESFIKVERPQHLRFKDRSKKVPVVSKSLPIPQNKAKAPKYEKKNMNSEDKANQDKAFIQLIKNKIKAFAESAANELNLPSSMTSFERKLVHEISEELGLAHFSVGEGENRRIVVQKEKTQLEVVGNNDLENDDLEKSQLSTNMENSKPPSPHASLVQAKKKKKKSTKVKKEAENLKGQKADGKPFDKTTMKKRPEKLPLTKAQDLSKKLEKVEEFDEILELVKNMDGVCFYIHCKTKVRTLGQTCQFCRQRFCFTHSMPEIHGCGEAVKKYVKDIAKREGVLYPGSSAPNHKPDPLTRANLEKKLDKKLQEFLAKRKPPKKSDRSNQERV